MSSRIKDTFGLRLQNNIPTRRGGLECHNVGWVKGVHQTESGKWGGYIWLLQNTVNFKTSSTNVWVSTNGVANVISKVLVGTIGDYAPMADQSDTGPSLAGLTNWPMGGSSNDVSYSADFTAYYDIGLPALWIQPLLTNVCINSGNVTFWVITNSYVTNGVTWSIAPEGLSNGATLTGYATSAVVAVGGVATSYVVGATANDNTNVFGSAVLNVVMVVIDNYTTVTYDGLDSLPLVCRIEPEGITPSSYAWSATWPPSAYNDPQVTFENPTGQVTRISNAYWYSMTPAPGTNVPALYDIYCTVQINGMSFSNATPASFGVDVYQEAGRCSAPGHTSSITYERTINGYFMVTSVVGWERIAPVISNAYTLNSQFYPKTQAHEQQHKDDYDNGYDGHMFVQKAEFEPMVIGLTNSTLEGLDAMVREDLVWYLEDEVTEMWDVLNEMEDRAYLVSDAVPPFYVYQRGGL